MLPNSSDQYRNSHEAAVAVEAMYGSVSLYRAFKRRFKSREKGERNVSRLRTRESLLLGSCKWIMILLEI
jgi:hypothetical protein